MTELPEGRKPITTMESADLVLRMHDKLAAGFSRGGRIEELEEMVEACKADAREAEAYAAELEAKLEREIEISNNRGNHIEFVLLPQMAGLEAKLAKAMQVVEMIASADVDAVLGQAVDISCEIIGELMEDEDNE